MKYYLALFVLFINSFYSFSQQNKKTFAIQLSMGIPFELPHKSVFKKNSIPEIKQFEFRLQKYLNQHLFLSFDLQRSEYNLRKDFIETFQNELYEEDTDIFSENFPIYKGIVNIGYAKKNTKENREFAISLGIGIQSIKIEYFDLRTTIYPRLTNISVEENNITNPLLQLTIENTWYINKFGINLGVKTQYAKLSKPFIYTETKFYSSTKTESSKKDFLTLIPTIGIRYAFEN